MDTITVDLNELYEKVRKFRKKGMDSIEISLHEADSLDSDSVAFITISAFKKLSPGIVMEEFIDGIDAETDIDAFHIG